MTNTLHVTVDTPTDRADLDDRLAAIDAGEEVEQADATLAVESLETFGQIFRPTNLRLLASITTHEPESLRELARIVDRNPPDVLDNINELETYGLIELVEEGRSKRPVVWYDEINVDMPLTDSSPDSDTLTA